MLQVNWGDARVSLSILRIALILILVDSKWQSQSVYHLFMVFWTSSILIIQNLLLFDRNLNISIALKALLTWTRDILHKLMSHSSDWLRNQNWLRPYLLLNYHFWSYQFFNLDAGFISFHLMLILDQIRLFIRQICLLFLSSFGTGSFLRWLVLGYVEDLLLIPRI